MRAERVYRNLLRAYPARFRQAYEREMLLVFRDQQREGVTGSPSYWLECVSDVVRSASREWRDEITTNLQTGERPMRGFAVVAVLVAAFELFNTAVEIRAGGFVSRDGLAQMGMVITIVSVAALLGAGVALYRSGRSAVSFAQIAAVSCLASFAFMGLVRPTFSILAMLLGIGFPIALLAWTTMTRGKASGTLA